MLHIQTIHDTLLIVILKVDFKYGDNTVVSLQKGSES